MVKSAIKVYARLKPEKCRKNSLNYQVLHRPKQNLAEDFLVLVSGNQRSKEYPDNRPESWNFSFFQIFEESSTQGDVFDNVARPVLESALDGYNGTVFAYGQTASGKTHTITGELENEYRGVIPRSLQYLFEEIRKRPENVYSIEVAYLEIYNEIGFDLLDRRQLREFAVTRLEDLPRINILEDEFGKLHLKNLSFHCVKNVDDAIDLLLLGNNNRVTADTPMNRQSSRSHCVFTIVVSTKEFGAEQYKQAKVHIVDLAGSERVYKCSITGTILTEAKHINLSLHYLEQVIVSLGQESVGHIPYRNSLLTSILRDSLGGNCLTVMLATVSVTSSDLQETVSTCRFAQRVALIKNYLKLNLETNIESENALLRAEIERLRQQIQALTKQTEPIPEDLNAEDKRNLDSVIRRFLESNEQVSWDYNPKKVQYCFESFKRAFESSKDSRSYLRKLEYYKDLVVQRDQEISLLIEKIKREKDKRCKDAIDDTSIINNIHNDKGIIDCVTSHVSPKKHKRKTKVSNRRRINYNENIRDDDSASRNKSFVTDTLMPDLLPCNVVNLTLTDLIEDKNETTGQKLSEKTNGVSQQSLPKLERPQRSVKKKRSNETESKMKEQNEQSRVESQSAKAKIITKETSAFIGPDISTPVYHKFLSFNAHSPKSPSTFKEDTKTGKKDFDRKLNLDENSNHFEDLPLTGDPEIDEEIIAFYKAKRSGGIY